MSTAMKLLMIVLLPLLVGGVIIFLIARSACCPTESLTAATLITIQPTATPVLIDAPKAVPDCRVSGAGVGDVLVRSYPGSQFAELGILTNEIQLNALGATDDGWLTVSYGEQRGWVRRESLRLDGRCETLPSVRNPMIPIAIADAEVFGVQVDRDGSASFHNTISTPDGDTADLVWITVINLYSAPPNNMREFTLTLECSGSNPDAIRWGWAYVAPTMSCGQSVTIPFMINNNQQPFTIAYAPNSLQSYIDYRLTITGVAAVDSVAVEFVAG